MLFDNFVYFSVCYLEGPRIGLPLNGHAFEAWTLIVLKRLFEWSLQSWHNNASTFTRRLVQRLLREWVRDLLRLLVLILRRILLDLDLILTT